MSAIAPSSRRPMAKSNARRGAARLAASGDSTASADKLSLGIESAAIDR